VEQLQRIRWYDFAGEVPQKGSEHKQGSQCSLHNYFQEAGLNCSSDLHCTYGSRCDYEQRGRELGESGCSGKAVVVDLGVGWLRVGCGGSALPIWLVFHYANSTYNSRNTTIIQSNPNNMAKMPAC